MALILAFRDRAGHWHGAAQLDTDPSQLSTLTFTPTGGEPGFGSPFAGQTLQVLVAGPGEVEADVGEVCYTLDDRSKRYATAEIDELLFGAEIHEASAIGAWPPEHAADAPVKPVPVPVPAPAREAGYWQLSDPGRHYDLTVARRPDATMSIEVVGADDDGRITARLDGHLPGHDHLALLGRLFLAAAADAQGDGGPLSRNGEAWSAEEKALVGRRYREGADVDTIAAELGRSPNSIRYKLHELRLGPFPGPGASSPRPRQAVHVPAYSMADLRAVHPNSHKRWEPAEDERLARRSQEGATLGELVREFGRNEGAITARLDRLAAPPPADAPGR
jgi:hypothetical protein